MPDNEKNPGGVAPYPGQKEKTLYRAAAPLSPGGAALAAGPRGPAGPGISPGPAAASPPVLRPAVPPPAGAAQAGLAGASAQAVAWASRQSTGGERSLARLLGNLFYAVGFAGEYQLRLVLRALRGGLVFTGRMLALLLAAAGRGVLRFGRGAWRDVTAPVRHFRRKLRQMRRLGDRVKTRGGLGGRLAGAASRVKMSLLLTAALVRYALPLAAAAVLLTTVYGTLSVEYALEVEIDGVRLGAVTDPGVVENAKTMLRDRIRTTGGQQLADWQPAATYTIGPADGYTTAPQIVNAFLRNSFEMGVDLVPANGLVIDGAIFAATTEGERLEEYLERRLAAYRDPEEPDAAVSFVRAVQLELNPDDVYFLDSVVPYAELIERLEAIVQPERRYTADEGDTLDAIAQAHGLTLDILLLRNPDFAGREGDFAPEAGAVLLIQREQPYLQVKKSVRRRSEEPIPYERVEQPNDARPVGWSYRSQDGAEGLLEVWDDYDYIDGELVQVKRVDEMTVTLAEPVHEITEVGTMEVSAAVPPVGGIGGSYIFPVPDSPYPSRGYAPYHKALDIPAPEGTAVYACEGGTVVTAGWHWSYGNYVVIEHPSGISTLYGHCSALYVTAGQAVGQGQHIAAVGNTGYSFGSHLHLEFVVDGVQVDPVPYVGWPW